MRILTRYILREVLSHALLGGALFTFILFIRDLGTLLELVVRNSTPLPSAFEIFLYTLPNTLTVTLPMAVLVGVLLGLSRMAADSEITAMRAAGIGVWQFVRIVSLVASTACGFGLLTSIYLAPRSTAALLRLEDSLKNSQVSFEVQPRVFYEDFKNYVLYVQDIRASYGAAQWHRVFLADLTDPGAPKITTAEQATVVNGPDQSVRMRMRNGAEHEMSVQDPNQYTISTFSESDIPIQFAAQNSMRLGRNDSPILAMSTAQLREKARAPGGRWFAIELQKRFSYPFACLVLMLVGVPLGLSSRRGGKGMGFVLTILLVFIYYFFSSTGVALARQDKIPIWLGVWAANLVFAGVGLVLLRQMSIGSLSVGSFTSLKLWFQKRSTALPVQVVRVRRTGRFPLILDDYVIREFLGNFVLVLVTFVMLMMVFTLFELLGDILRNRVALIVVGEYLLNLLPSMVYLSTPLGVLIAGLATFGVLQRTSELTAMKATGISLYRVLAPIFLIAALLGVTLFLFDNLYIPSANRKQEALRNSIKGKPAQTFLRPDRKWIFGQQPKGGPARIFYYQLFDADHDEFGNVTVFDFNPDTFLLTRRIFASSAHWEPQLHRWVFERGSERTFAGDSISGFRQFDVSTFPEISEQPQYFKKEVRQSSEMSFGELEHYIRDLQQSGFDVVRLRIQLNHKLAFPSIVLVMAVLAVPFAISMGKRGSLSGIAVAIGIAMAYWVVSGLFEAMGNASMLPPALAAWSPDILFGLTGGYLLLRTPT